MYSEETFKNYIFWLKVKRAFFILLFSVAGCLLGLLASHVTVEILKLNSNLKIVFVVAGTLVFFALALLVTAGTGKEVQDGYWKIAVLRKLTVISKKLDRITVVEPNQVVQDTVKDVKKSFSKVLNEVDEIEEKVDLKEADKQDKKLVKEEDIKEDIKDIIPEEKEEVVKKEEPKKEKKEEKKVEEEDEPVKDDDLDDLDDDVYPKIPTIRDDIE